MDHLFKECRAWEGEIRELWSTVGKISRKRESKEEMDRPFKSRKVSAFMLGRQGRGPATPLSGSYCPIAGTLRRCWSFWGRQGWERLRKELFVNKRQDEGFS